MDNCWVFFRDIFGRWQWERHGEGMSILAASRRSFAGVDACRHDAVMEGYRPTIDEAIFPPEFEQEVIQ